MDLHIGPWFYSYGFTAFSPRPSNGAGNPVTERTNDSRDSDGRVVLYLPSMRRSLCTHSQTIGTDLTPSSQRGQGVGGGGGGRRGEKGGEGLLGGVGG